MYKRKRTGILFSCILIFINIKTQVIEDLHILGTETPASTSGFESSPRGWGKTMSYKYIYRMHWCSLKIYPKAHFLWFIRLRSKNFCFRGDIWPILKSNSPIKPTQKAIPLQNNRRCSPSNWALIDIIFALIFALVHNLFFPSIEARTFW